MYIYFMSGLFWERSTLSFEKIFLREVCGVARKEEAAAYEIGDRIAAKLGVSLVFCEYKKEGTEYYLRLFIDKPGGVGIDDCENFSRRFSDEIDKCDPTDEAYILEVSSPGAQRILTCEREFLHYIGTEVEVKLYAAKNGVKEFSGILKDYADMTAYIETEDGVVEVKPKEAVYIRLLFRF